MAIISRLSLQGAVFRPLAGELASAVTYCVSSNSASLEPVTCWSGQVGRIRKSKRKSIYWILRTTASSALSYGCTYTGRQFYLVYMIATGAVSSSYPYFFFVSFFSFLVPKFLRFYEKVVMLLVYLNCVCFVCLQWRKTYSNTRSIWIQYIYAGQYQLPEVSLNDKHQHNALRTQQ